MKKSKYVMPLAEVRSIGTEDDVMQGFGFDTGSAKDPDPNTPHYGKPHTGGGDDQQNAPASNVWED